jgi:hypothetical protein
MFITVKIFQPGKAQGPYSQHLIFFVTYEMAQKARVLNYTRRKGLEGSNTQTYWVCW